MLLHTAELISAALEALPSPPDGTIGNSTGEPYDDAYFHLFVYNGRVAPECQEAWKKTPLVLYDAGVVAEVRDMITFPEYLRAQPDDDDVTSVITQVLLDHTGPVACLRVDSSVGH